jgi:hypothetical protein
VHIEEHLTKIWDELVELELALHKLNDSSPASKELLQWSQQTTKECKQFIARIQNRDGGML